MHPDRIQDIRGESVEEISSDKTWESNFPNYKEKVCSEKKEKLSILAKTEALPSMTQRLTLIITLKKKRLDLQRTDSFK